MAYKIIYRTEPHRIITACIIDSRKGTFLANKSGQVINDYVSQKLSVLSANTLTYKIEEGNGTMVGYFALLLNTQVKTADLQQSAIRTAFSTKQLEINQLIANFISGGEWKNDFLFDS